MQKVLSHFMIRTLAFSLLLSITIGIYIQQTISNEGLQIIRLTQINAFIAVSFLYCALIIRPSIRVFSLSKYVTKLADLQRACIMATAYFGFVHANLAFFGQLDGFAGLSYLNDRYLLAIGLSFTALILLLTTTMTFLHGSPFKFPKSWKEAIHHTTYIAGTLILIHALMLGTHFHEMSDVIPQIFFSLVGLLLLIQALATDQFLAERYSTLPRFGIMTVVMIGVIGGFFIHSFLPPESLSFGIHTQHTQTTTADKPAPHNTMPPMQGLQGDRTKRYTVSFDHADTVRPGETTTLRFRVFDAANGKETVLFQKLHEKLMHLIIVDDTLSEFTHVHPVQKGSAFSIEHRFAKNGTYHLYTDFQPFGAIEQQIAFTLHVGETADNTAQTHSTHVMTNDTYANDTYTVTLQNANAIHADTINKGEEILSFAIDNKQTGKTVTTLHPYLGAFGHLVLINAQTFEYIHVHPTQLVTNESDRGKSPVDFMPFPLYAPVQPGTYRVFVEFNPDGKLLLSDFTISIK